MRLVMGWWLVGLIPCAAEISAVRLDEVRDRLAARNTQALVIVKDGKLIYQWYREGAGEGRKHYTASLAKSLVGGMSLLVALQDGRLRVDDPAWKYIPAWKDDPVRSRITIRQLATHSAGIEDAEEGGLPHDRLGGWKGEFWKRTPDPISVALRAPVLFEPGWRYAYSNPGMAALAYAVTAALGEEIREVLKRRVLAPIGVPRDEWSIGYGESYALDGLKVNANWGGGSFTPRAAARVGQLLLQRGVWEGRRVLDSGWVRQMVSYAGTPIAARPGGEPNPASGLGWWNNFDGVWKEVPRDAFAGAGAGHQLLLVVPSLGLVVVRNGGALDTGSFWRAAVDHVFHPVLRALALPPYPEGRLHVRFAPESEIVRQAIDSDNWPMTWADDDDLYTAYGDGWGFDPRVEKKLSLGLARISGMPPEFRAANLRSADAERTGEGRRGPKASGMLMAGRVLYMWVRNEGNARLAWSDDHGKTWQWGFRFDVSFGSPAFLNFGKNYAAARDGYVYVYSQDGGSAYESDDRVVLARAPRKRIREREAYEFFVRPGEWTRDVSRRGAVFEYPAHCQRVDAVYVPGLRRYLLAVGYNHEGGWGIFDAPEPWGPWTTAFHTTDWGLGGTHGYRLPSKWLAGDGRSGWLVFSGVKPNDAFCVRRFEIVSRGQGSGVRGQMGSAQERLNPEP